MSSRLGRQPVLQGQYALAPRAIILIVEDDADLRQVLAEVIRDEGLAPITAANGREALDLLEAGLRPSGIFLDMMMPVMNGLQFRTAQRQMPECRSIPVALVSASGASRAAINNKFGDVEYIPKPVTLTQILAFLRHCHAQQSATK